MSQHIRFHKLLSYLVLFLVLMLVPLRVDGQGDPNDPRQPEYIFSVAWSPDGSRIAVGMGPEICNQGNNDYSVRIVDASTGEIIARLADWRWTYCPTVALDWSPDGTYLIGTQLGATAIVWDVNSGETLAVHGAPTPAGFINNLWSPNGDVIVSTANVSPLVQIWNPFTGEVPIEFDAGSPVAVTWRSDGSQLAASGDAITIWDAASGQLVSTLTPAAGLWVYWSPDESMIASFSRERIYLWDASAGNLLVTLEGHTANLRQLAWNQDSRRLASAGSDGTVQIWDTLTGEQLAVFTSPGPVRSVDWSPDGTQLVYGGVGSEEQDAEMLIVVPPATPAADAGPDQTLTDTDASGSEPVTLDGSGSSDPDGTIVGYAWTENVAGGAVEIATGATPSVELAVGVHTITLTVTDDDGLTASDEVVVTVEAAPEDPRVTDGLQVLYTFAEGEGTVVHDVSGVGTPLDLTVANPAATTWTADGLAVNQNTIIQSAGPATKVIDAVTATQAITIEAWVRPANITQTGPARIVSMSTSTTARNFTLGQGASYAPTTRYTARLRTTTTTLSGTPEIYTPNGSATINPTHVVFTRDTAGVAHIYLNGSDVLTGTFGGDLSNWDATHPLLLANELTGDRPWLGELYLVALYNRALSPAEVHQNHVAGPYPVDGPRPPTPATSRVMSDLQVCYTFEEAGGSTVYDVSGVGDPLDLHFANPNAVSWISGALSIDTATPRDRVASLNQRNCQTHHPRFGLP